MAGGPSSVVLLKKVLVEFGTGDSKDAFEVSFSSQEDKSDLKALQEAFLLSVDSDSIYGSILPKDLTFKAENKEWGGREVNIKGMDIIEDRSVLKAVFNQVGICLLGSYAYKY